MSGRVTAGAERVYINQGSTPETRKEFEAKAKQCVALRIESNRLDKSIGQRENRIEKAQNGIAASNVRSNQASENINNLNQEKSGLSDRQKKIEEAKLKALQRKNS